MKNLTQGVLDFQNGLAKNLTERVLDFRNDLAETDKTRLFLCNNYLNR